MGTRVWFATNAGMAPGDGSLAEWCAVPAADLVPISGDVPDAAVAAIGTSGIAAWMALTWRAGLQPGERVVVLGASGAVGQVALAVARELGAGRVVAVVPVGRPAADRARECGAHEVVVLDPAEERAALTARLVEAAGGPVDVVDRPGLRRAGRGGRAGPGTGRPAGQPRRLGPRPRRTSPRPPCAAGSLSILGYTNNAISAEQRAEALTSVLALAARGVVSVDHRVLPLADCDQAWTLAGTAGPRVVVAVR